MRLSAKGLDSDSCPSVDFLLSLHSSVLPRRLFCVLEPADDLPRLAVGSGPFRLSKASDKAEQ